MQKVSESWDSSSCHSFCSTNDCHFRNLNNSGKKLDVGANYPETVSLSKEPSRTKDVFEEGEVFADTSTEVEEGEIKDSSGVESCDDSHRSPSFEKGRCTFGEKSQLLRQSDNNPGLSGFDRSRLGSRSVYSRPRLPLKADTDWPLPAVSPEKEDDDDWDRVLEEEKLRVGFSRKKVPFDELSLTIRTTRAAPVSAPSLENKTPARRVRYLSEKEPGLPGLLTSKRNNTRGSEKARLPSPKSTRYNKRRYSDTSRSRSRSLSAGRRFSCKCCRTPSPKQGRGRASSRRPICFYRRKSISSSSSSPSPVSRNRVVTRRVRDVAKDPLRKRRGRSRTSSPDRTKIRLYIRSVKASGKRRLDRESQTSKTRRESKAPTPPSTKASKIKCNSDKKISPTDLSSEKADKIAASYSTDPHLGRKRSHSRRESKAPAPSSPKASKIKCSSEKKISPTDPSSDKVYKLAASYSTYPYLSDSISPYSSDSDCGQEHDIRSSSIRRPSDMSISPFSDSQSLYRFPVPVWRADEPTCGIAAQNLPTVPRKGPKSNGSAPKKRIKYDVAERKPSVVLPQGPISKSLTPKRRLRSEVRIPKPSTAFWEVPKYVGSAVKNILQSDVAKTKLPVDQQEAPKSERSTPKTFKSDVAEPKASTILQEISKSMCSNTKQKLKNNIAGQKPSPVPEEMPKSERSTSKQTFKNDVAELKPSSVPQEISKSMGSNPKKKPKNDVAEPKLPVVRREMPKTQSSAPKKKFNNLLSDLMKFHKKESSTKVAVNTVAAHSLERREMSATKVGQKSAAHRDVSSLSRKEILMKQLQELTAAIERKRALAKVIKAKQWQQKL